MKCLMKYQWVKLPRNHLPEGKGIMNAWAKLASRAAFRKGQASYCGHINAVSPGMWSGGIVGLKSILGAKSRSSGDLLPRRLFGQYREKAASGDVNANAAGKKKSLPLIY